MSEAEFEVSREDAEGSLPRQMNDILRSFFDLLPDVLDRGDFSEQPKAEDQVILESMICGFEMGAMVVGQVVRDFVDVLGEAVMEVVCGDQADRGGQFHLGTS